MKKTLFTICLITFLTACDKGETEIETIANPLIGTSWTAPDEIGEIIWGQGTTKTIEFLDETQCQTIQYRPSQMFNKTVVTPGTYIYGENKVTWTEGDRSVTGTISGSIITVPFGDGTMVYTKN